MTRPFGRAILARIRSPRPAPDGRPAIRLRLPRYLPAVLVGLGTVLLLVSAPIGGPESGAPRAAERPAQPLPAAPVVGSRPAGERAQPAAIDIPAIDVHTPLIDLGRNPDGTLAVPDDYQVAGWYASGAMPGETDGPPAVIVGHVDSTTGPAVFYRLRELTVGDEIQVRDIAGAVTHFTVYRLAEYAKDAFPAGEVYAPSDAAELRLITCTGQFDRRAGSYRDNLVAYARLAGGRS
ncbi:class F sortase [Micromonospora sp. NPDC093277]|uniref:class F sortase n=1 Tax=Micromonospora sp. NPDC093277 TaxID=3364291 RepID=UPI00382635AE